MNKHVNECSVEAVRPAIDLGGPNKCSPIYEVRSQPLYM